MLLLVLAVPAAHADEPVMAFGLEEVTGSMAVVSDESPRPQAQPAQTAAERTDAEVATILGELRWGMSSKELVAVLKARVQVDYARQMKLQRDILRQDELYQESKARIAAIKDSFVVFDARKNGWDASQLAPEFRRGTGETMLWFQTEQSRDYYFFIQDKLWKWYRELEPGARGAVKFDTVAKVMQLQLGPASVQPVRRADDAPIQTAATWQATHTRVTLLDRGAAPCLIFESQKALAKLPTLRRGALDRGPKRNVLLESVIMDAAARERLRNQ